MSFLASKLHQVLDKWNCFRFDQILTVCSQCILKKALFLPFLRSVSNTYLITLSLEKKIIVLEKGPEKTLSFRSKNLYEPCMLDFWFIAIQSISIFNLRMYFLMVCSYRKINVRPVLVMLTCLLCWHGSVWCENGKGC